MRTQANRDRDPEDTKGTHDNDEPPGEPDKVVQIRYVCETGKWSARTLLEEDLDDEIRAYGGSKDFVVPRVCTQIIH
jgi:hypothetical protein